MPAILERQEALDATGSIRHRWLFLQDMVLAVLWDDGHGTQKRIAEDEWSRGICTFAIWASNLVLGK